MVPPQHFIIRNPHILYDNSPCTESIGRTEHSVRRTHGIPSRMPWKSTTVGSVTMVPAWWWLRRMYTEDQVEYVIMILRAFEVFFRKGKITLETVKDIASTVILSKDSESCFADSQNFHLLRTCLSATLDSNHLARLLSFVSHTTSKSHIAMEHHSIRLFPKSIAMTMIAVFLKEIGIESHILCTTFIAMTMGP